MNIIDRVESRLFSLLKSYNIKLDTNKILNIDTNQFYRYIILLKSKKAIFNTEFVLLSNLRSEILEIQKYKNINNYNKLDEHLDDLEKFTNKKSNMKSTNFINVFNYLSSSSKESIVNSTEFNDFNEYLHIHRPIESILKESLNTLKSKDKGIILLVGSVGDGKSHLLSYINKNHHNLVNDIYIYNDATESDNPYKTAVETLAEKLENFETGKIKKLVIAINIGMLHNLKEYLKDYDINNEIIETIATSNIFSNNGMENTVYNFENITIVSFLNEQNFFIENGKITSEFCNNLFNKIFQTDMSNPFYKAFMDDDGENRNEPPYQNYKLLLNPQVQETVIHLLIKIQIENKRIISTRALLNFIHDIIIPDLNDKENDSFLVNLLFNNYDKSSLLSAVALQDPIFIQDSKIDKLNIELYNTLNLQNTCLNLFGEEDYQTINNYLYLIEGLSHKRKFEMIVRLNYLFNYKKFEVPSFFEYINLIENIESNNQLKKNLLNKINTAIYEWKGSPQKGFIYNESIKPDTTIRIGLQFNPKPKNIVVTNKMTILVTFEIQNNKYNIEVDYNLYKLMKQIENGYILKEKDKVETVVFSEFVDNILNNLESNSNTIINIPNTNETYLISEGFLGYEIKEVE